jgi:hypothetical protein
VIQQRAFIKNNDYAIPMPPRNDAVREVDEHADIEGYFRAEASPPEGI